MVTEGTRKALSGLDGGLATWTQIKCTLLGKCLFVKVTGENTAN